MTTLREHLEAIRDRHAHLDGIESNWCGWCGSEWPCRDRKDAVAALAIIDASSGVERIATERQRQISVEGWGDNHDNDHTNGQLARAASVYAMPKEFRAVTHLVGAEWEGGGKWIGTDWPWEPEWYKPVPSDRIRELVKAGALIAAEIDRLLRDPEPSA